MKWRDFRNELAQDAANRGLPVEGLKPQPQPEEPTGERYLRHLEEQRRRWHELLGNLDPDSIWETP